VADVDRNARRLKRQFDALGRRVPALRGFIDWLTEPGAMLRRLPASLLLMMGSLLFFLPGFGLWMLPLAIMLLAVDLALLRSPVLAIWIGFRRRLRRWRWRPRRG
jgi:hypothetical protein